MSAQKKTKSAKKGQNKTFAAKRTVNPPQRTRGSKAQSDLGSSFQQHDAKRRLGSFEGAGEHARTGNRGHQ